MVVEEEKEKADNPLVGRKRALDIKNNWEVIMKSNNWVNHLALTNMKKHRKRNIFSILSLVVGLTSSFLIIGFSSSAENSTRKECYKQIDYGSVTLTKENKSESTNGGLSIIRNSRPSFLEMKTLSSYLDKFEIDLNFAALVPNYSKITCYKEELKEYTYECVYSFLGDYFDKNLLLEGEIPKVDSLDYVLINEKAKKDFVKKYGFSPLGESLHINNECTYSYYTDDEYEPIVSDYFLYDKKVKVVGIVKDLNFLSTPKLYYSYVALKEYLSTVYLTNLSTYYSKDISWVDRVMDSNDSDEVNSYTYRLFLKNYQDIPNLIDILSPIKEPFSYYSASYTRTDALLALINAATTGMELFLIITLIGTALIMGIVSFSFYSEDKKTIAILSCLGAKMDNINDIYCVENMLIGLIAFLVSIVLSPLLQLLINLIVHQLAGFSNIISIPFSRFLNIPLGLPVIILVGTIFVSIISTMMPIAFSKKISLKEELKDE